MSVLIAPQLFVAVGRLPAVDQARVIDFITKFQQNPANPGVSLERIQRAKSPGLWSGRITQDLRAILHKDGEVWAILYADRHDEAYSWATRREVGRHSITGALQIVEAVETVKEVERVIEVMVAPDAPPTFHAHADDYLLSLGVPETWLPTLRKIRDDDQLLTVCERLTPDVAERLMSLASGEIVTPPAPILPDEPAIAAVDTRRRFYVAEDAEGLLSALEAPLDRWIAFLHPSQRAIVERAFNGPAKVSGSAGTGKTVVAMHRARYLARRGERVLVTSYVTTLCDNVEHNLGRLCRGEERDRITVSTVHKAALGIVRQVDPRLGPASDDDVRSTLKHLGPRYAPGYDPAFLESEWFAVVRMQGIHTWDAYRSARRTGRGKGLAVRERKALWQLFAAVLEDLEARRRLDWTGLCHRATELLETGRVRSPYTAVIVDEVQDLRPTDLRFLRALCDEQPGNLMLCGDAGQRIYPGGFSLSALGIEVRGRSSVLRINYRTTEQIRRVADRMLGELADDMDGGHETRSGTRSLLRGPDPDFESFGSPLAETEGAIARIRSWLQSGLALDEIAVFARTRQRLDDLEAALSRADLPTERLSDRDTATRQAIQLGTMHRAKGLEFKAVLVLDCGDAMIPSPAALRHAVDPQDREAAEAQERRLLYVALTRARDELAVSWTGTPSRFLEPLLRKRQGDNP